MPCSQIQGQLQQNTNFLSFPFSFVRKFPEKIIQYWLFLVKSYSVWAKAFFIYADKNLTCLPGFTFQRERSIQPINLYIIIPKQWCPSNFHIVCLAVWLCTPVILISRKLGLQRLHLCPHCTKVLTSLLTLLWNWKRNSTAFREWNTLRKCIFDRQQSFVNKPSLLFPSVDSAIYTFFLFKKGCWHLESIWEILLVTPWAIEVKQKDYGIRGCLICSGPLFWTWAKIFQQQPDPKQWNSTAHSSWPQRKHTPSTAARQLSQSKEKQLFFLCIKNLSYFFFLIHQNLVTWGAISLQKTAFPAFSDIFPEPVFQPAQCVTHCREVIAGSCSSHCHLPFGGRAAAPPQPQRQRPAQGLKPQLPCSLSQLWQPGHSTKKGKDNLTGPPASACTEARVIHRS